MRLLIAIIVLLISPFVFSQKTIIHSDKISKVKLQVLSLNNQWANAVTNGDSVTLNRLFADDIIVTSGSGEVRNKKQEIKDAAGPPDPNFSWINPFITENVVVSIYDNAAIVTGLAKWSFSYKSKEVNQERRYTHTYINRMGVWKIVAQHISSNLFKNKS